MAYEIDQVFISTPKKKTIFSCTDGNWSRSVTTTETTSDTKEEMTSISACTAEDIIVELLLNMCHEGINISARKGPMGTWVLSQAWMPRDVYCSDKNGELYQPYLDSKVAHNHLSYLMGDGTLDIK